MGEGPLFKRADVVMTSPQGQIVAGRYCTVCSISPGQSSAASLLMRTHKAKLSAYHLTSPDSEKGGALLPDGVVLEPWVMTSHGVWNAEGFRRLRILAKEMAERRSLLSGEMMADCLHQCMTEVYGEMSRLAVQSEYEIAAACAIPIFSHTGKCQ